MDVEYHYDFLAMVDDDDRDEWDSDDDADEHDEHYGVRVGMDDTVDYPDRMESNCDSWN